MTTKTHAGGRASKKASSTRRPAAVKHVGRAKRTGKSVTVQTGDPVKIVRTKGIALGQGASGRIAVVDPLSYRGTDDVSVFAKRISSATPMQLVEVERTGVDARFVKDLSRHFRMPAVRMYEILDVPKATVEKRISQKSGIAGTGGQAAIAMAKLLAQAQDIVANSTAPEAADFDVGQWLGRWIERPQPALGGRKPAELIGTPTGAAMVSRLLGAIESGAYQ